MRSLYIFGTYKLDRTDNSCIVLWQKIDPFGPMAERRWRAASFPYLGLPQERGRSPGTVHQLNAHPLELQAALQIRSDKLIQSVEISVVDPYGSGSCYFRS